MHIGSQISAHRPVPRGRRAFCSSLMSAICELGGSRRITVSRRRRRPRGALRHGAAVRICSRFASWRSRRSRAHPASRSIIEPGRFLVAEAGVLLARVLYRKRSGGKEIRRHRRGDERAHPPVASTSRLPRHRSGERRRQRRGCARRRRARVRERRLLRARPRARRCLSPATSRGTATLARTATRWRPTTTRDCVRPKCWSMGPVRGRSRARRVRRSDASRDAHTNVE